MQSVQNANVPSDVLDTLTRRYTSKLDIAVNRKQENDKQSAKDCIELAEILEELYTLKGHSDHIGDICSRITADFKDRGIRNWSHVSDYLPQKYKRDYDSTGRELSRHANILDNNLLALQEVNLANLETETKQKAFEILSKFTNNIEQDAQAQNYALFRQNDDTFDSTKPKEMERTVSTQKQDPKPTEFSDAIQIAIDALIELKKDAMEFPPAWKAQARIYSQGWLRFAKIIRWLTDDKFSLDAVEWFNKENYRMVQGKHAAAVHDKVETVLCVECSKELDNDPDCYEIMYADFRSPSGWRCGRCKGTKGMERGMTREQVGDRSYYTQQWAADTIQELPWMTASLWWYRDNKKPINNARKIRLSPKLSKLA